MLPLPPKELLPAGTAVPQEQWQDDNTGRCHIPSIACNRTQGGHSLSDGVLEPDPEFCT